MKRSISLVLSFCISISLLAQTTMEEFKYLVKGYDYQLEMGVDPIKKGYQLKSLKKAKLQGIKVQMFHFYKDGQAARIPVATLMSFNYADFDKGEQASYICIPHPNSAKDVKAASIQLMENLEDKGASQRRALREALVAYSQILPVYYSSPKSMTSAVILTPKTEEEIKAKAPKKKAPKSKPAPAKPKVLTIEDETTVSTKKVKLIKGGLVGRRLVSKPKLAAVAEQGQVSVKVCVNEKGNVLDAKFNMKESTTSNQNLIRRAVEYAEKFIFEESEKQKQCGIITVQFEVK